MFLSVPFHREKGFIYYFSVSCTVLRLKHLHESKKGGRDKERVGERGKKAKWLKLFGKSLSLSLSTGHNQRRLKRNRNDGFQLGNNDRT